MLATRTSRSRKRTAILSPTLNSEPLAPLLVLTRYLRSGKLASDTLPANDRIALRLDVYLVAETIARMQKTKQLPPALDAKLAASYQKSPKQLTNFIPLWVKVAVSLALGLGTMIGWKRIVVTVGEKIGKAHLTHAQGAAAELV